MICTAYQTFCDQIKDSEMDGAYGMYRGRREMRVGFWW
jgi:hypothetical protein